MSRPPQARGIPDPTDEIDELDGFDGFDENTADAGDYDDDRGLARRFFDWLWDIVRSWGPALLVVLMIRSVLAEPFRIPSGSMVPTLAIGDHILVTKSSYGLHIPLTRIPLTRLEPPERGDVIVFVFPGSDTSWAQHWLDLPIPGIATLDYVKRVVGLPGDTVEVRDNKVYINGELQPQSYDEPYTFVDDHCRPYRTLRYTEILDGHPHAVLRAADRRLEMRDWGPETVPEGHVFAMGDNRDHSADSRVWGFVPFRNIKGRARMIWLSYDQCQPGLPIVGTFRTGRMGSTIE